MRDLTEFLKQSSTLSFIIFLCMMMPCSPVFANLSANPILMIFQDGASYRKDITLINHGNQPLYLEINTYRITKFGSRNEELKSFPDPKKVGLVVSPRRMILNPTARKKIRVVRLKKSIKTDHAWRIEIKPIKPKIIAGTSGIVIQIGYKALVIARPENAKGILTGQRNGNQLVVKNTGNTNNVLREGKQCNNFGKNCKKVRGRRIWPNSSWTTKLPYNTKVTFDIIGPNDRNQITF